MLKQVEGAPSPAADLAAQGSSAGTPGELNPARNGLSALPFVGASREDEGGTRNIEASGTDEKPS
jgi:hypothetical protein